MKRDDEVEQTAIQFAMDYERENSWFPVDDPAKNLIFETNTKGVQYILPETEWKKLLNS